MRLNRTRNSTARTESLQLLCQCPGGILCVVQAWHLVARVRCSRQVTMRVVSYFDINLPKRSEADFNLIESERIYFQN
jgi:hypothetical protein